MSSDKFGSPINRKSKTWFLTFLNVYVSESNKTKFWPHSFHLQNSSILQTRMDQRGTPWKWILTIFKCKNEVPKQLGLEKQMKKMRLLVLFSYFVPELWSLNCQKLCPFCNFWLSKKFKAAIAIYVYASESFRFALLKMVLVIMLWLRV